MRCLVVIILVGCTTEGDFQLPPCEPQTHTPTTAEVTRVGALADQLDQMDVHFDLDPTDIHDSLSWSIQRSFPVVAEYEGASHCGGLWEEDVVELAWEGTVTSVEGLNLEGTGIIGLGLVSGEVRWDFSLGGEPEPGSTWEADLAPRDCGLQGVGEILITGHGIHQTEQEGASGNLGRRSGGCTGSYGSWGPN